MSTGIMDPGRSNPLANIPHREMVRDRGDGGTCNMPRIPTGRYPAFSTTLAGTFDAAGAMDLELEAERDLLLTDMSVGDVDATTVEQIRISAEYCNTKYLVDSSQFQWQVCCDERPAFLVGVRENKTLRFRVTGGTPDADFAITLQGFQGNGCCG